MYKFYVNIIIYLNYKFAFLRTLIAILKCILCLYYDSSISRPTNIYIYIERKYITLSLQTFSLVLNIQNKVTYMAK